jgi:hypothetical protein
VAPTALTKEQAVALAHAEPTEREALTSKPSLPSHWEDESSKTSSSPKTGILLFFVTCWEEYNALLLVVCLFCHPTPLFWFSTHNVCRQHVCSGACMLADPGCHEQVSQVIQLSCLAPLVQAEGGTAKVSVISRACSHVTLMVLPFKIQAASA